MVMCTKIKNYFEDPNKISKQPKHHTTSCTQRLLDFHTPPKLDIMLQRSVIYLKSFCRILLYQLNGLYILTIVYIKTYVREIKESLVNESA